ncbi:MAG: helicase-exonuclease AddAB subunit AddA [Christensenellales bacterium]|jgi:ATP-dependent helicase/nuclease subunit A
MPPLTSEQQNAVSLRGRHILVSAAAGSGKTTVLIRRIIAMVLEEGVSVENLLVVTFTRAAAAQMRQRLQEALEHAAQQAKDPKQAAHLAAQLDALPTADICTMDAFCIRLLQEFYPLADLSSDFRVADQREMALLKKSAVTELFDEQFEAPTSDFLKLVRRYGTIHGNSRLAEMLLEIYEFMRHQGDPALWLRQAADMYDTDEGIAAWQAVLLNQAALTAMRAESLLRRAVKIAKSRRGPRYYLEVLTGELNQARRVKKAAQSGWDALISLLEKGLAFPAMRADKKAQDVRPSFREKAKRLRDDAKIALRSIGEQLLPLTGSDARRDLEDCRDCVREMVRLVSELDAKMAVLMSENGVLDFSGIELAALTALDGGAAEACRARYKAIFFDEYQDANGLQEAIVSRLCREDNLFYVGDIKQSIYRFRMADPSLFIEKYDAWGAPDSSGALLHLPHNFRSRQTILKAVNSTFSRIMLPEVCGMLYDQAAALRMGNDILSGGAPVELHVLENAGIFIDEELQAMERDEREAHLVADRVARLLKDGTLDDGEGGTRPVRPRDIVILSRSAGPTARPLAQALAQRGIESYSVSASPAFDTVETRAVVDTLRVIDNPRQDIPLLGALKSPLFGFTLDELAKIRLHKQCGDYIEALEAAALSGGALGARAKSALLALSSWRALSRAMSVSALAQHILDDTGYEDIVSAWPLGDIRRANLKIMLDTMRRFEAQPRHTLSDFLAMAEEDAPGSGEAAMPAEDKDVVTIMSIHKSKGLEFPIVIVPYLGRRLLHYEASPFRDQKLGLALYSYDDETLLRRENLAQAAIAEHNRLSSLAEEMRILYVAMTRAQQQLIMTGTVQKKDVFSWFLPPDAAQIADARSFLDWVGPCVMAQNFKSAMRDEEAIFTVKVHAQSALKGMVRQDVIQADIAQEDAPGRGAGWLEELFAWQYPHMEDTVQKSKYTVSEIVRAYAAVHEEEEQVPAPHVELKERPSFQKTAMGARRGTLIHVACRHLDFARAGRPQDIADQLNDMARRGIFSRDDIALIPSGPLTALANSELGRRMALAQRQGRLRRETPFSLPVKAREVPGGLGDETVLLQGAIDAWFEEAGHIVLVDFKSDRAAQDTLPALMDRYRPQLAWYAHALEQMLDRPVSEVYLYAFALGRAIDMR